MESRHEKLAAESAGFSLGAAFVFEPDQWVDERGRPHEPADLVWACGRTVILMCLTTISRSAEKATQHNLRQLRGGLRAWRDRKGNLTGNNAFQEFDLNPDDFDHVALFSIVEGPAAIAERHQPLGVGTGAVLVASVPQQLLDWAGAHNASPLDLIEVIGALESGTRYLPADAIAIASKLELAATSHSRIDRLCSGAEREWLDATIGHLRALRVAPTPGVAYPTDLLAFLVDLRWTDFYSLVARITFACCVVTHGPAGSTGPTTILTTLRCRKGAVAIVVDRTLVGRPSPSDFPQLINHVRAMVDPAESVLGLYFALDAMSVMAVERGSGSSATSELIGDTIYRDGLLRKSAPRREFAPMSAAAEIAPMTTNEARG